MSQQRRGLLFNGSGQGPLPRQSGAFDLQELPIVISSGGLSGPVTIQVLQVDTQQWVDVMVNGAPLQLNADNTFATITTQGAYRIKPGMATGAAVIWFHEEEDVPEWNWGSMGGGSSNAAPDKDEQTLSLAGTTLSISNGNSVDIAPGVKAAETLTTLEPLAFDSATNTLTVEYTGEDGVKQSQAIDLSALVGVTDITGLTWDSITGATVISFTVADGSTHSVTANIMPVFVNTDNQQLTGDTTGTVNLTLTPVVVGESTNYTAKADLPLATSTPNVGTAGGPMPTTNALKYDPARGGWYVIDRTATVNAYNAEPSANLNLKVDIVTSQNSVDYFVSGSLPLATKTPSGGENCLKYDKALGGFYVDCGSSVVPPTGLAYVQPACTSVGATTTIAATLASDGGEAVVYTMAPAVTGATINASTGLITFAPAASVTATTVTITATNSAGSVTATVSLETCASGTIQSFSYAAQPCTAIESQVTISPTVATAGTAPVVYSISPADANVTIDPVTGVITFHPTKVY